MPDRKRVPLDKKGKPVRERSADDTSMPVRRDEVAAEDFADCKCPRLDRADWDAVESDWSDITFVKGATSAVMGVPVGYDTTRDELRKKAEKAGATIPEDAMLLNGSGKFRRPVWLEVEGAAAGAKDIERPGGIAFTRIFEAPWGQLNRVAEQTEMEAKEKYGRKPDATWVWYLTCRVCSKERNFETLIAVHYRTAP
jgi:hypothetical protein